MVVPSLQQLLGVLDGNIDLLLNILLDHRMLTNPCTSARPTGHHRNSPFPNATGAILAPLGEIAAWTVVHVGSSEAAVFSIEHC